MSRLMGFSLTLCLLLVVGCGKQEEAPPTLTVVTFDIGNQRAIMQSLVDEFVAENDCEVRIVSGPNNPTECLIEYQASLEAHSSDIDIYQIDVVWPGILESHLINLADSTSVADFFPPIIENNNIGGRLVAVPFYTDVGLLYYRTDLMEKYGYPEPPKNLKELGAMAKVIMDGERAEGHEDFYGIVFQGDAYEGLTCNALEWYAGSSNRNFLDENGHVVLDTVAFREALTLVKSWIGDIAPQEVLTYQENVTRDIFKSGNAAFMRNWPYAYAAAQREESPVQGKVSVAPMVGLNGLTGTIGGWSLAVSKYSKEQELAKKLVEHLTSEHANRMRAFEGGYFPVRTAVYADPKLEEAVPYYKDLESILTNSIARPASFAGVHYDEVSLEFFSVVHDILSGKEKDMSAALKRAEHAIRVSMPRN